MSKDYQSEFPKQASRYDSSVTATPAHYEVFKAWSSPKSHTDYRAAASKGSSVEFSNIYDKTCGHSHHRHGSKVGSSEPVGSSSPNNRDNPADGGMGSKVGYATNRDYPAVETGARDKGENIGGAGFATSEEHPGQAHAANIADLGKESLHNPIDAIEDGLKWAGHLLKFGGND